VIALQQATNRIQHGAFPPIAPQHILLRGARYNRNRLWAEGAAAVIEQRSHAHPRLRRRRHGRQGQTAPHADQDARLDNHSMRWGGWKNEVARTCLRDATYTQTPAASLRPPALSRSSSLERRMFVFQSHSNRHQFVGTIASARRGHWPGSKHLKRNDGEAKS
jgi:hypothetical protein